MHVCTHVRMFYICVYTDDATTHALRIVCFLGVGKTMKIHGNEKTVSPRKRSKNCPVVFPSRLQARLRSPKGGFRSKPKFYRTYRNRDSYGITSSVQHGLWALKIEAISKSKYRAMSKSNRSNRDLPCL